MTPHEFLTVVMVYCSLVGGSVSSWGRTLRRNVLVKGVPYSPHRFWLGCDVELDSALSSAQLAEIATRLALPLPRPLAFSIADRTEIAERLGLYLEVENDHDHLQPLDWRAG